MDTIEPGFDVEEPRGGRHLARNAAIVVGILLVAFVALLATRDSSADRQPEARVLGQAVPAVQGSTLAGTTYDIDDHRGSWVVVNFFASWCVPCRTEHPELVRFAEEHRATGDVQVVGVVFNDQDADVRAFFAENGGDWPVLNGNTGPIALSFGVTAVPESYLVSPDGQVVAKFEGVTADKLDEVIRSYEDRAAAASTEASQP